MLGGGPAERSAQESVRARFLQGRARRNGRDVVWRIFFQCVSLLFEDIVQINYVDFKVCQTVDIIEQLRWYDVVEAELSRGQ